MAPSLGLLGHTGLEEGDQRGNPVERELSDCNERLKQQLPLHAVWSVCWGGSLRGDHGDKVILWKHRRWRRKTQGLEVTFLLGRGGPILWSF